jgi:hypothetical protein
VICLLWGKIWGTGLGSEESTYATNLGVEVAITPNLKNIKMDVINIVMMPLSIPAIVGCLLSLALLFKAIQVSRSIELSYYVT